MKLRVARHTTDLEAIKTFYHDVLGLEILGTFESHESYDGLFLGLKDQNWHLEFTVSDQVPDHKPDEDDLLVFYTDNEAAYDLLLEKFTAAGIESIEPKNSYWKENARTYQDPDGFRIVISYKKGR